MNLTFELQTFLLAMAPIGELRVAIPVALTVYKINWLTAYIIAVMGNLTSITLILIFLPAISKWLSQKFTIFKNLFTWLFDRTRKKYNGKIEKYGYPALILFVAIPLPVTGGWTGALAAFLFGIPFKKAFPSITLGILIAGGLVLGITQAGITVEKHLGWQVLAGLLCTGGLSWIMYNKISNNKNNTTKNES